MTAIRRTVIKHPNSAYVIVAFVSLCATAIVRSPIQFLVYLVPLAGAAYIARTATIVDGQGLTARALLGSQSVTWDELIGLRLDPSGAVYAVDSADTQLRLPCLRSTKLAPLIAAGGGRIPDPAATPPAADSVLARDDVDERLAQVEPAELIGDQAFGTGRETEH